MSSGAWHSPRDKTAPYASATEHDTHCTTPHIPEHPSVARHEAVTVPGQRSTHPSCSPQDKPPSAGGHLPRGGRPAAAPPAPPYQGGELSRAAEAGRAHGVGAVSHPHAWLPASPCWHATAVTDARAVTPSLQPQLPRNACQPAQPQRCCGVPKPRGDNRCPHSPHGGCDSPLHALGPPGLPRLS